MLRWPGGGGVDGLAQAAVKPSVFRGDGRGSVDGAADFVSPEADGARKLRDPGVVADEREDEVHVAPNAPTLACSKRAAEVGLDAQAHEDEACGKVVLLGVVTERGVVPAGGEEGIAPDDRAAPGEDFGQAAGRGRRWRAEYSGD